MGHQLEPSDNQSQSQQQLSVGNGALHEQSPYLEDFKELLAAMSTKTMVSLLSTQQRNLATALWEAENFGGRPKPGDLKSVYPKRNYYELVLLMDHRRQWDEQVRRCKQTKNC